MIPDYALPYPIRPTAPCCECPGPLSPRLVSADRFDEGTLGDPTLGRYLRSWDPCSCPCHLTKEVR